MIRGYLGGGGGSPWVQDGRKGFQSELRLQEQKELFLSFSRRGSGESILGGKAPTDKGREVHKIPLHVRSELLWLNMKC